MKINIITQPLYVNYGGTLQNFALQSVLRRLGHEPLTVNGAANPPGFSGGWREMLNWKLWAKTALNGLNRLRGLYPSPFINPNTHARREWEFSQSFKNFEDKHIAKVDVKRPFSPDTAAQHPADLWIVGSDQVWRPWCTPDIPNFFFDFLPSDTPHIAYAASFGVDQWELSPEDTQKARELVKRFRALSVREASGVSLCREHLSAKAEHLLDPTLLLTDADYRKLTKPEDVLLPKSVLKRYNRKSHRKNHRRLQTKIYYSDTNYSGGFPPDYIAAYILDPTPEKLTQLKEIYDEYGLPIQRIGMMRRHGFDTVEQWLATLDEAAMVVTDSFHGTAFSVIFDRPVRVLSNDLRGNSRLQSLIDTLHLKQDANGFYCLDDESRRRLAEERSRAMQWLETQVSLAKPEGYEVMGL